MFFPPLRSTQSKANSLGGHQPTEPAFTKADVQQVFCEREKGVCEYEISSVCRDWISGVLPISFATLMSGNKSPFCGTRLRENVSLGEESYGYSFADWLIWGPADDRARESERVQVYIYDAVEIIEDATKSVMLHRRDHLR